MTIAAALKFTQGATVGTPGQALVGTDLVTAVTCENGNNTDVTTWVFTMLSVPYGSAVPLGTFGSGSTAQFTPDVRGSYRVKVRVSNASEAKEDIRIFAVATAARSWIIPAFDGKATEHNFSGQLRGWAGTATPRLLDYILKDIESNGFGGGSGHTIREESTPLTARTNLSFVGANLTATDNAGADSTDITFSATPTFTDVRLDASVAASGHIKGGTTFDIKALDGASTRTLVGWAANTLTLGDDANASIAVRSAGNVGIYRGGTAKFTIGDGTFDFLGATGDGGILREGQVILAANAATTTRNAYWFTAPTSWNSGDRVVFFANRTAGPTANDAGGAYVFGEGGGLRSVGSHMVRAASTTASLIGQSGFDRVDINYSMVARNAGGTVDLDLFRCNGAASITLGNSTMPLILNGGSASLAFQTSGSQRLHLDNSTLTFHGSNVTNPTINQGTLTSGTGGTFTWQAQNISGAGTVVGGKLVITAGTCTNTGAVTSQTGGDVEIYGGDADGSSGTRIGGKVKIRAGNSTAGGINHGWIQLLDAAGNELLGIAGVSSMGFFGVAATTQPTDVGALTDSTGGTADGTVADVGASFSQATLNNNFADLTAKVNGLRTRLRTLGLMA